MRLDRGLGAETKEACCSDPGTGDLRDLKMISRSPCCTEGDAEAQGRAENCPSHKVRQSHSRVSCPGLAELLAPLGAARTKWREDQVAEVTDGCDLPNTCYTLALAQGFDCSS